MRGLAFLFSCLCFFAGITGAITIVEPRAIVLTAVFTVLCMCVALMYSFTCLSVAISRGARSRVEQQAEAD